MGFFRASRPLTLRKKRGSTVVIDRWSDAPALSLADEPVVLDIIKDEKKAARLFSDCDAVLPANENMETLEHLVGLFGRLEVPLIFRYERLQGLLFKTEIERTDDTIGDAIAKALARVRVPRHSQALWRIRKRMCHQGG